MAGERELYEVLQVHPAAEQEVIESAYRRLARKYHPDVGGSAHRMTELNAAYEILSHPAKRAEYDAVTRGRRRSSPTEGARPEARDDRPPSAANDATLATPPASGSPMRWLLVLPAAAAGVWASAAVFTYAVEKLGPEAPFSFFQRVLIHGALAAISSSGGIIGAVAVAPSRKRAVATCFGTLNVLFAGFLIFPLAEDGNWWGIYAMTAWASGAIFTALQIRDALIVSR